MQEVTVRSGRVIAIAIASEGGNEIQQLVEHVIPIPTRANYSTLSSK